MTRTCGNCDRKSFRCHWIACDDLSETLAEIDRQLKKEGK